MHEAIIMSRKVIAIAKITLIADALLALAACGSGSASAPTYSVGGTVSGLAGSGLVLSDGSGDHHAVSASGFFTIETAVAPGAAYSVSVMTQPQNPLQTCVVHNGNGIMGSAPITNVSVTCTTNTLTVGGVVSGLAGSGLVLVNNGSDDIPVSIDGSFVFATPVANGQAYSVIVRNQPANPNQSCVVVNGGGVVGTGKVTNIAVDCTNLSDLGAGEFWIPYKATPVSSSSGGQTGVFVIPSSALTTAPAYVTTSANTMVLASGLNLTLNGSNVVTAYSPATYMYAATDTSNNIHVYGLNLASESVPTPTQISSLSLPLARGAALNTVICDFHGSSGNLRQQPATIYVVLHIAGKTGCNTSGDVWEVLHYTDSSASAPEVVSITTTDIQDLYAPSGARVGLLLLDPASKNVYLYANDSFTSPATAIGGGDITSIGTVYSGNGLISSGAAFTGTNLFLAVTKTGGAQYLYRLPDTSTIATLEYTASAPLGLYVTCCAVNAVADSANLYFTDDGNTQLIFQEPLTGGTPTELYSYARVPASNPPYLLVGSNGSLLVMSTYEETAGGSPPGSSTVTSYLATLPVGKLSPKTTALGAPLYGYSSAFMREATPGIPSTALVFVTHDLGLTDGEYRYGTEVVTPSGTVKQADLRDSSFLYAGTNGYVLQTAGYNLSLVQGINAINLETLASNRLTTSAGTPYTVTGGNTPSFVQESNLIGAGVNRGDPDAGLAYDPSRDLIASIVIANTNVTPF
jgi:hypothetical protein